MIAPCESREQLTFYLLKIQKLAEELESNAVNLGNAIKETNYGHVSARESALQKDFPAMEVLSNIQEIMDYAEASVAYGPGTAEPAASAASDVVAELFRYIGNALDAVSGLSLVKEQHKGVLIVANEVIKDIGEHRSTIDRAIEEGEII